MSIDGTGTAKYKGKYPPWLQVPMPAGETFRATAAIVKSHSLTTVCQEARCPNIGECWRRHTATFMILGENCTRHCRFCAVNQNKKTLPPDPEEPERIAQASKEMGLKYIVMTSVTRDDLPDGGAAHFVACVKAIKRVIPSAQIEVLTPDFRGNMDAVRAVALSPITVFNHNVEMVPRLYPAYRPEADYLRSLTVLSYAKTVAPTLFTKSGLMVGLGETLPEVLNVMDDMRDAGITHLTIGQYLCPREGRVPVVRYVTPQEFDHLRDEALTKGFLNVNSLPLARSSYHADQQ